MLPHRQAIGNSALTNSVNQQEDASFNVFLDHSSVTSYDNNCSSSKSVCLNQHLDKSEDVDGQKLRRSGRKRKPTIRYRDDEDNLIRAGNKRLRRSLNTTIKLESKTNKNKHKRDIFPIHSLPVELCSHVVSFLNVGDVRSLSLVSRDFNKLCNDSSVWKRLSLSRWPICDVLIYDYQWKELFKDQNRGTQRGWYTFEIPEFSKRLASGESFFSPPFAIGSFTWTLLIFPRSSTGPYLSVYLSVKNTEPLGPREAGFSFILINQKDPQKSFQKDSLYGNFVADERSNGEHEHEDWGFTRFAELDKITDPNQGFLMNDTLILKVYVANLSQLDYWITLLEAREESQQLEAINAIVQSSYIDDNKKKIAQMGGLRPIMNFLSSSNVDLQRSASDALWNLTSEDANKELVRTFGGTSTIVNLLTSSDKEVQRNIVNVCWNLSTIDHLKRQMEEHGAIISLIQLLHDEQSDIHLSAVMVLWNLSTLEEFKEKIVQLGAVPPLASLLYSLNEEVLLNTINLLWALAEDTANSHAIIQHVHLDLLMPLLHHRNPEIVKNTLFLFGSLSEGNATFILRVEEKGGVNELFRLLYSGTEEVVGEAANALSKLMYYHKIKNVSRDIIARLIEMLRSTSDLLIETAILALLKVALHETNKIIITELGGLDSIIPLLSKTNYGIQGDTAIVITNLATNPLNKIEILSKGGLTQLLPLLKSDKYPKNFAACAIASLLENESAQAYIMDDNRLDLLLDYLVNSTEYLEGPSHIAMAIVKMKPCYHDAIAQRIRDLNVIQTIIATINDYQPGDDLMTSQDKREEKRDVMTPTSHTELCCMINLLGYFSLLNGDVLQMIRRFQGESVLHRVVERFSRVSFPHISFLVNWALSFQKRCDNSPMSPILPYSSTELVKISDNGLEIRNDSCFFESFLRSPSKTGKRLYYEVECISNAYSLIGWATPKHRFHIAERKGVGDDLYSWSYEPRRGIKWTNGYPTIYGDFLPKQFFNNSNSGTITSNNETTVVMVIGCSLDLIDGTMSFSLNGKSLGVAFSGIDCSDEYSPALSLSSGQQCFLNFGETPFHYMPNGFTPYGGQQIKQ